jgi:ACR3 family arsenite efflux pump ArsB
MPSMSSSVTSSMGEVKEGTPPLNNHDEPCTVVEDEECGKDLRALDTFVSDVSRDEEEENPDTNPKSTKCHSVWSCITTLFNTYSFMIYAAAGIILAYSYPPLGAVYVYPKITSSYIAVITIFLLSGIGLRTKELKNVYKNINFNIFVVVFNFGVVSAIVFGIAKFLLKVGALSEALAQGLIICGCLALTVNMVFILTAKAGGDEALGIFHAAFVSYAFSSVVVLISEDKL